MSLEEKYKEYTNKQLIEVVIKADDYQPAAVEMAKLILQQRDISNEEREQVKKAIEIEETTQEIKEQRKSESEDRIISFIKKLFNKINPLDKSEPATNKIINLTGLVFGYLLLEQLYYSLDYLAFLLEHESLLDFYSIVTLFEVIYLPLTIYFFFKRKKNGWIMLVAWISYFIVSYIAIIIYNLNSPVIDDPLFELISYQPNYTRLLLILAFFLGSLSVLLRRDIKKVFSISNLTMYLSILIGVLGVLILMVSMNFINLF
jgi:hypothetical protein